MKKIISFIICIIISSGFLSFSVSAEKNTVSGDALKILQALNMVNEDYDELTLSGNESVTRAEFANIAAGIFCKGLQSDKLYFHDVPREHWVFGSVGILLERDFIRLNAEKKFNPDLYIRRIDAARIVLRALGYGHIIDTAESSDAFVAEIAQRSDLFDGVSAAEYLTLTDMFTLLYNGLLCETMEFTAMSESGAVYENSGETFLEANYSIYFEEGILEGFDGAAINTTELLSNEALISGVRYKADGFSLKSSIGMEVSYLFSYDKNYDERTLLWIETTGEDKDRISLDYYENQVQFHKESYTITYYDGSKKKSIDLSKAVSLIYNGEFVNSNVEEILSNPFYSMVCVRHEKEHDYSTVLITAYENFVVAGVDSINEVVYDKISGKQLSLKNIRNLEISASDGREVNFSDIKNGDVLSIEKSVSGERVKVTVSDEKCEGVITRSETDRGYNFSEIDGVLYRTKDMNSGFSALPGDMVALYLDGFGYIADFEYLSSVSSPAYLLKTIYSEDDESLSVKIVDKTGEVQILHCSNKIKIDGMVYKVAADAYTVLGGKNRNAQLIVFNKNADGVVTDIDTLTKGKESESSLHVVNDFEKTLFKSWGLLGNKMNINSNTIIFGIPDDLENADEDDFVVKKMSNLTADTYYISGSFSTKENVEYEEIVVIQGYNWNAPKGSTAGILVSGIFECVNEENEVVEYVIGYQGTAEIQILCDYDYSLAEAGVKKGDFIVVSQNASGEIVDAVIKYSPWGTVERPTAKLTHVGSLVTSGYAKKVVGNMVEIGHESAEDYDCRINFSRGAVLVYDSETEEITEGTVADVIPHEVSKDGGSLIVGQFNWMSPVVCIIYK